MPQGSPARLPRRHRIVRFWLFSYIFIFMVSFVACSSAFFIAYSTIENGITQQNRKQMEQIILTMDRSYSQAKRMIISIQLDSRLTSVINVPSKRNGSQNYNCYTLQKLLKNFCIANDAFQEIGVYLTASELLITNETVCTFDLLPYLPRPKLSDRDWNAIFSASSNSVWMTGLSDNDALFLARRFESESGNACYIETIIHRQTLLQAASDFLADGAMLIVTDSGGSILFDSQEAYARQRFDPTVFGDEYAVLSQSSAEADLVYHYLVPLRVYHQERDRMLSVMLVALCVSLLIGFASIFFFIRFNYAPITKLLHYIQPNQDLPNVTEYEIIRNSIVHSQQQLLEIQLDQHRKETIYQILSGQYRYSRISAQTLQKLQLTIQGDTIYVIIVSFGPENGDRQNDHTADSEQRTRILEQLSGELRRDRCELICVPFDLYSVMILSGHASEVDPALDRAATKWQSVLPTDPETDRIAIGISRAIASPDLLSSAFAQAKECVAYIETFEDDLICRYEQLEPVSPKDKSLVSENSLLIAAVMNGHADEVHRLMQLIHQSTSEKHSLFDAKYTLYFLYHVSIQIRDSFIARDSCYPQTLDSIRDIFKIPSVDRALNMAETILLEACSASETADAQQAKLSSGVRGYIEANYIDPSLNVNTLADAFGLSASYLSRKFRQETGVSIPDEINQLRVKKAKELLLKTELRSSDIAEAVGFLDSNALIRVFKKYEGVTPGTYRQGRESDE